MKDLYIDRIPERITGSTCPRCHKQIDGGTRINDEGGGSAQPLPGDFSVCLYCGTLLRYDEQLRSIAVPRAERRKLGRDPRLRQLFEIGEQISERYRRRIQ
jgi:hypothetical protein